MKCSYHVRCDRVELRLQRLDLMSLDSSWVDSLPSLAVACVPPSFFEPNARALRGLFLIIIWLGLLGIVEKPLRNPF